MSDFPYLIAIALVRQQDNRLMPIGGKSIKEDIIDADSPGKKYEQIALELLLRLLERTEKGSIKRENGKQSLLIVKLQMEMMQEKLPILKAKWIESGNTELFLSGLNKISTQIWSLDFVRYEGLKLEPIN
mgnify:CR=1 FL=1